MIHALRTTTPFIDLGFGITQQEVPAGTPVTVWVNTLYNQEVYSFTLTAPGAVITKISNYEYSLTYATPGTYTISLGVSNTGKKTSLASNILTITVTANEE